MVFKYYCANIQGSIFIYIVVVRPIFSSNNLIYKISIMSGGISIMGVYSVVEIIFPNIYKNIEIKNRNNLFINCKYIFYHSIPFLCQRSRSIRPCWAAQRSMVPSRGSVAHQGAMHHHPRCSKMRLPSVSAGGHESGRRYSGLRSAMGAAQSR